MPSIMHHIIGGLLITFSLCGLNAQVDTMELSLGSLVALAELETPSAAIAETRLQNSYWRYQSFLANYRPQISLNASLPNLNRSIDAITLPDGSDAFVERSLMRNNLGVELQQWIPLTGGRVFANTSLQRIDLFNPDGATNSSYLSVPINVGLRQPIFGFNAMRWERQVEPLRYKEAERGYHEERAAIGYEAATYFFRTLNAQLNLAAAQRDKAEADTLYLISQGRYSVGKIAETELLQIELNARNAEANLAQSSFEWQNSMEQLRTFLGLPGNTHFRLRSPVALPELAIDADEAVRKALQYRSETIRYDRQIMEAERELERAIKTTGPQFDLFLAFGLSQTATQLDDAYREPLDQQQIQLGLQMPIADWGKGESQREIARSNLELVRMQSNQDRITFEREIRIKVQQFEQFSTQVELAERALTIAEKSLDIARQRYRIGKIGIAELNLSLNEESSARSRHYLALQQYWLACYDLRRLTLFDFISRKDLSLEN